MKPSLVWIVLFLACLIIGMLQINAQERKIAVHQKASEYWRKRAQARMVFYFTGHGEVSLAPEVAQKLVERKLRLEVSHKDGKTLVSVIPTEDDK